MSKRRDVWRSSPRCLGPLFDSPLVPTRCFSSLICLTTLLNMYNMSFTVISLISTHYIILPLNLNIHQSPPHYISRHLTTHQPDIITLHNPYPHPSPHNLPFTRTTSSSIITWAASSEFGPYRLCEQRRFRRACASAQSRQNLRCSLIQAVSQEEPSDRKPDPWPL